MTEPTSDRPKVFVFAPRDETPAIFQSLDDAGLDRTMGDPAWQLPHGHYEDAVVAQARDAVAMMGTSMRHTPVTRRVMEASQRLRIIAKYSVGVDDVDTDAATELGIMVTHGPTEANCFGVAESVIGTTLALVKRLRERDAGVRDGTWRTDRTKGRYIGGRMSDGHQPMTIGIVGFGRIGQRVAQLLAPWRARVIACDPYIAPDRFLLANVPSVDYATLLRESDVVTFHCNLTKETRYMLSEPQIRMMKPGAIVINAARGKIIDEAALAAALADGHLLAAGIDAFEEEPVPQNSPLLALDPSKILLSPHSASFDEFGALRAGVGWAARSVITALSGGIPDNVFNTEVIPRWKERFGGVSLIGAA